MCPLDWTKSARNLHNQVRGMNPWPVATCRVDGKVMKVFVSRVGEATDAAPGTVVSNQPLSVACGDGLTLILDEIQAEGSRRMVAADYLRGHPIAVGSSLID
jgi:methionyl-tRNA formyltransferase